jgi:L-threonylcarbamoyladenylate synthase
LILPKRAVVPDLATSGLPTVAIRFPSHPVARRLIELSSGAVAAPSANPFGYLSPTRASHVAAQLGDRVDFIVDGGPCAVGVESTVLDLTAEAPTVLRPGGMELTKIEAAIGPVAVFDRSVALPTAPGQLASHYAPRTPLYLYKYGALTRSSADGNADGSAGVGRPRPSKDEAVLCFDAAARARIGGGWGRVTCLTERDACGDYGESAALIAAAAALFETLHELDAAGFAAIRAEKVPNVGLGPAVNDRLFKASVKSAYAASDAAADAANPR